MFITFKKPVSNIVSEVEKAVGVTEAKVVGVADDVVGEIDGVIGRLRDLVQFHTNVAQVQREAAKAATDLAEKADAEAQKAAAMIEKLLGCGFKPTAVDAGSAVMGSVAGASIVTNETTAPSAPVVAPEVLAAAQDAYQKVIAAAVPVQPAVKA
ncbi:hypothetical protein [Ferrovum sp.]|uniref:hypothetical protein n=1 Tax=Ferrovum sp. TaxID=2609467 RepID=UPI002628ABF7|nr:hypothetical protein [Ferrovum sp.]